MNVKLNIRDIALGLALILGVAGLFLPTASGCKSSGARSDYSKVNDLFTGSVRTLNLARSERLIDEATWANKILPIINAGNSAVRVYDEATKAGQPGGDARNAVLKAIEELTPYLTQVEVNRAQRRSPVSASPSDHHRNLRRFVERLEAFRGGEGGAHREREQAARDRGRDRERALAA